MSPFELLEFELSSLGHRHALQIGHQLIHRGLELLDKHGLHFFRHKFGELTTLLNTEKAQQTITVKMAISNDAININVFQNIKDIQVSLF